MDNLPHISESEWDIMVVLWEEHPLTAAQIVKRVQVYRKLAPTTVKTLLRRLITKNAVSYTVDEINQKLYHYSPAVDEQDCVVEQSEHFLSHYFKDNIERLFSTFVDSSEMTDEEIESLKKLLDEKKRADRDV